MLVLVTGGAGYIGSHVCLELLSAGHKVVVVDNLSNSRYASLERVQQLAAKHLDFYPVDLLDKPALEKVFQNYTFDAVMHFAGLKAVGESIIQPLRYYHNNLVSTLHLCELMQHYAVHQLIFSSSATVYGDPAQVPIIEECPLAPTNPYGRSKWMIECFLKDLCQTQAHWSISILRYFNPVGAHSSGQIGEQPTGIPNNLMPYIAQVAVGKLPYLSVFGNNYLTPDGTGVRDYIHVVDLAAGHVKALEKKQHQTGISIYNLGTGRGYTVLEVIVAFEAISQSKIPYKIVARRPGDIAQCYANSDKANRELGWKAERDIETMCRDAWCWQYNNPSGYE